MKSKQTTFLVLIFSLLNAKPLISNNHLLFSLNGDNSDIIVDDTQNNNLNTNLNKVNLSTNAVSGYSHDSQQQTSSLCFHATSVSKSEQTAIVNFDSSTDISTLAKEFSVSLEATGGYKNFSSNGVAGYLHSIEETAVSKTYNFYWKLSDTVNYTYSIDRDLLLTPNGERVYRDGANPEFRLICGDTLINSYDEAAALIVSIVIQFRSQDDKKQFSLDVPNLNYKDVASGGGTVKISNELSKTNSSINITAYQIGGDTTQLNMILGSSNTSDDPLTLATPASKVACTSGDISNCATILTSIKEYVSTKLPDQFKKPKDNTSSIFSSPLVPIGNIVLGQRVDLVLSLSDSYVTQSVIDHRKDILKSLNENSKVLAYLTNLIANYPVAIKSDLLNNLNAEKTKISQNLSLLINNDNGKSPNDCWTAPQKCEVVYNYFKQNLQPINYSLFKIFYYPVIKFDNEPLDTKILGGCTINGYFYPYGQTQSKDILYVSSNDDPSSLTDTVSKTLCHINSGYAIYKLNNLKYLVPETHPHGTFKTWSGSLYNDDSDQFIKDKPSLTIFNSYKYDYSISYSFDTINSITLNSNISSGFNLNSVENPFNPKNFSSYFPRIPKN